MKGIKTPTQFVRWLWETGYLASDRSLWDVKSFSDKSGYSFTNAAVHMALKRAHFISNIGKNSIGVPLFKQKYPYDAESDKFEGSSLPKYIDIFMSLNLHPEIKKASSKLFLDGHYSEAIFAAFKKINNMVKAKSGRKDLDGVGLMTTVFSKNSPILKLNSLESQTDKDEQEGFMHLFVGAILGIRNPKGHDEIIQDDPFKTIEYICFASLLAKTIDSSHKTLT